MSVQYNQLMSMESVIRNTDLKFDIIRSRNEFLSLRSAWIDIFSQNHNTSFYLSFDWFYFLICIRKISENLYIIVARKGTEVVAIIPCCINKRRICFFRHNALELIGDIHSPYRGCIVKQGQAEEVVNGLICCMLSEWKNDWQFIHFEGLLENDDFIIMLKTALEKQKVHLSTEVQYVNIISDLSTFENSDFFFRSLSKNIRQKIRRCINKMNRCGGFDIILIQNEYQNIEKCMDDFDNVLARSWRGKHSDKLYYRQLARYISEKGALRLFILYMHENGSEKATDNLISKFTSYQSFLCTDNPIPVKGMPVAILLCILFENKLYSLMPAYREDVSEYSAGSILFWFSLKHLMEVDHIKLIDHLRGSEKYKFDFGGHINDKSFKLVIANPKNHLSRIDLLCRDKLFPPLRRMKRRVLNLLRNKIYKGYTYGVSIDE